MFTIKQMSKLLRDLCCQVKKFFAILLLRVQKWWRQSEPLQSADEMARRKKDDGDDDGKNDHEDDVDSVDANTNHVEINGREINDPLDDFVVIEIDDNNQEQKNGI